LWAGLAPAPTSPGTYYGWFAKTANCSYRAQTERFSDEQDGYAVFSAELCAAVGIVMVAKLWAENYDIVHLSLIALARSERLVVLNPSFPGLGFIVDTPHASVQDAHFDLRERVAAGYIETLSRGNT
jgi:hypothetical protein